MKETPFFIHIFANEKNVFLLNFITNSTVNERNPGIFFIFNSIFLNSAVNE